MIVGMADSLTLEKRVDGQNRQTRKGRRTLKWRDWLVCVRANEIREQKGCLVLSVLSLLIVSLSGEQRSWKSGNQESERERETV